MKIALLGYGKMGKTIEKIALKRGHKIILKIDDDISKHNLNEADIAIDFSIPEAAFTNITTCFNNKIPVVSGTTGWLNKLDEAKQICEQNNTAFIYASNFSLGVNIFFELNKKLAQMMEQQTQYNINIEETHHTEKLDAPSGTAITLAEDIIANTAKNNWKLGVTNNNSEIPIEAKREPNVPGTHKIVYSSDVDNIEIKHTAHSREGFALGAVIAAEWLCNKKGIFTMKDVLGL